MSTLVNNKEGWVDRSDKDFLEVRQKIEQGLADSNAGRTKDVKEILAKYELSE
jgi:t-SNARE complex subunit (syntaxin)